MTEESTADGTRSIDTVIRGFTDAELALREVSGAVERLRSASEQLDASRADQAAARDSLAETSAALHQLGAHVESTVTEFQQVKGVLASIDPERLWQSLDAHALALRDASNRSDAGLHAVTVAVNGRLDHQDRLLGRLNRVTLAVLALSLAAVALAVAVWLGLLPIG